MTVVYLLCFLLIAIGSVLILGLTPERVSDDLMRFASPETTLREKVLTAKGKKKSSKLTASLNRIKDALESTGKGSQFTVACAASLGLMIIGCVVAVAIDNLLLIPVFAIAFALIPFAFAKRTINYYDNHVLDELETALSIITTSYVRSDDIVTAVKENVQYLKPPVRDIFACFVAENSMISANIKQSIKHLREKVKNSIFKEWCDTLIACQDDRTLKDTLMPVVAKLAITVMIVAFVLVFAVNVVSLVALNQNIKTAADQLTDYAAMKGTIAVDEYALELKDKLGVDFSYSFAGSETLDSTGKVQLGEKIVCTLTYNLRIIGFGEVFHPVSISASSTGLSQIYWK